jgi:hypothetical protein
MKWTNADAPFPPALTVAVGHGIVNRTRRPQPRLAGPALEMTARLGQKYLPPWRRASP